MVKANDGRYTQPFLLSTGNVQNPEHYFMVVDRIAISCEKDLVKALDMLFKSPMYLMWNMQLCYIIFGNLLLP